MDVILNFVDFPVDDQQQQQQQQQQLGRGVHVGSSLGPGTGIGKVSRAAPPALALPSTTSPGTRTISTGTGISTAPSDVGAYKEPRGGYGNINVSAPSKAGGASGGSGNGSVIPNISPSAILQEHEKRVQYTQELKSQIMILEGDSLLQGDSDGSVGGDERLDVLEQELKVEMDKLQKLTEFIRVHNVGLAAAAAAAAGNQLGREQGSQSQISSQAQYQKQANVFV